MRFFSLLKSKTEKYDLNNIIVLFMLAIYPLIVIPGPLDYFRGPRYLILIIIFLLSIYGLVNKNINFKKPYFYFLGLFFLFALISTFLAQDVTVAWIGSPKWYTGVSTYIFCVTLFVLALHVHRPFNYFIPMAATASVVSLIAILQHIGIDIIPHELSREGLASFGTMGHPNWLGVYTVLVLPAAVYHFLESKHYLWLLSSCLIYAALLTTMTRGAWIAFFIAFLVISIYFHKKPNTRRYYLILIVAFAVATLLMLPVDDWALLNRVSTVQDQIESSVQLEDRGGSRRIFIWKGALGAIQDNFYFGLGADNFSEAEVLKHPGMPFHKTHNIYLELFVTMGAFAFLSYTAFLLYIFIFNLKNSFLYFIVIFTYLVNGLFNHDIIEVFPLFWIVLGLSLSNRNYAWPDIYEKSNQKKHGEFEDESNLIYKVTGKRTLIKNVIKALLLIYIVAVYFWFFFPDEKTVGIPGGGTYTGEMRGAYYHGEGAWESGYGVTYEGEFRYGKFDGFGIMSYADGAKYVGEFRENQMHGEGKMIFSDGRVKKGVWKENEFVE